MSVFKRNTFDKRRDILESLGVFSALIFGVALGFGATIVLPMKKSCSRKRWAAVPYRGAVRSLFWSFLGLMP